MPSHNWGNRPRSRISQRIKDQVRRRDGVCQLQYEGCTQRIDEMDHVIGLAAQGIPRTPVLNATTIRGVCRHCHSIRSEQQRRDGIASATATSRRRAIPDPRASQQHYYQPAITDSTVAAGRRGVGYPWLPPPQPEMP